MQWSEVLSESVNGLVAIYWHHHHQYYHIKMTILYSTVHTLQRDCNCCNDVIRSRLLRYWRQRVEIIYYIGVYYGRTKWANVNCIVTDVFASIKRFPTAAIIKLVSQCFCYSRTCYCQCHYIDSSSIIDYIYPHI